MESFQSVLDVDWPLFDTGSGFVAPSHESTNHNGSVVDALLPATAQLSVQTIENSNPLISLDQAPTSSALVEAKANPVNRQNHRKHFTCTICLTTARKSFKTTNDLDRHMKSVHKKYTAGDKFWVCGMVGCPSATKCWPRLDNFKAHVVKMHKPEYQSQLDRFCHTFTEDQDTSSAVLQPVARHRYTRRKGESIKGEMTAKHKYSIKAGDRLKSCDLLPETPLPEGTVDTQTCEANTSNLDRNVAQSNWQPCFGPETCQRTSPVMLLHPTWAEPYSAAQSYQWWCDSVMSGQWEVGERGGDWLLPFM